MRRWLLSAMLVCLVATSTAALAGEVKTYFHDIMNKLYIVAMANGKVVILDRASRVTLDAEGLPTASRCGSDPAWEAMVALDRIMGGKLLPAVEQLLNATKPENIPDVLKSSGLEELVVSQINGTAWPRDVPILKAARRLPTTPVAEGQKRIIVGVTCGICGGADIWFDSPCGADLCMWDCGDPYEQNCLIVGKQPRQ